MQADFAPDASGGGTDTSVNEKTEDYNAAGEEDFPQPIISSSSTSSPMVEIPVAGGVDDSVKGGTMSGLMRWGVRKRVTFVGRHKNSNITNQEPTTIVDGKEPAVDRTRKRKEISCESLVETSVSLNQMQKELGKITSTAVVEETTKKSVLVEASSDHKIKERSGYGHPYGQSAYGQQFGSYGQGPVQYPAAFVPSHFGQILQRSLQTFLFELTTACQVPPHQRDPFWVAAGQYGKGLISFRHGGSLDINAIPGRFSNHGLFGKPVSQQVQQQYLIPFDPTFGGNYPLMIQLIEHWANVEPHNTWSLEDERRFEKHCIDFWEKGYTKHALEVQLDQLAYFTTGLRIFRRLENALNSGLADWSSPTIYYRVMKLDAVEFKNHVLVACGAEVYIRVSKKALKNLDGTPMIGDDGKQVKGFELREVKVYLNGRNLSWISAPSHLVLTHSEYDKVCALGTSNYNPATTLYISV